MRWGKTHGVLHIEIQHNQTPKNERRRIKSSQPKMKHTIDRGSLIRNHEGRASGMTFFK